MASNLELKCRRGSCAESRELARGLGAAFEAILVQTDTYFHVPHGRLKLRRIDGGRAELIHYERPDETGDRWSTYVRVPVADPEGMTAALGQALGIRCVVRKTRELHLYKTARIHIDEVDGLGSYLEFEVVETPAPEAEQLMAELRAAFRVRSEDVIAGSYGEMLESRKVE
jgi:predicted adenylyl cyclase CyaB